MVRAESEIILSECHVRTLELRSGKRTCRVTVNEALVLAHSLLQAKRYETATRICEKVASVDAHNPQAAILLACCEAGVKDYSACQRTLQAVFFGDKKTLAKHLQAAFVYHNLGMNRDATCELIGLTNEHPDLPMAWLLLGDLFQDMGKPGKASLCWRLAIDRDQRQGVAALAAQQELAGGTQESHPMPGASDKPLSTNDQS